MNFRSFDGGSMYGGGNQAVENTDKNHGEDEEKAGGGEEPARDRCVLEGAHGGLLDRAVLGVLDLDHAVLVGDWNSCTHGHDPHARDHARGARETGHLLRLHRETNGDVPLHSERGNGEDGSVG